MQIALDAIVVLIVAVRLVSLVRGIKMHWDKTRTEIDRVLGGNK